MTTDTRTLTAYSIAAAAAELGVSRTSVKRWIDEGKLTKANVAGDIAMVTAESVLSMAQSLRAQKKNRAKKR